MLNWVALHPDRPCVAASFVANDLLDAQGIGISKRGRGAQVTIVLDGETIEQAVERLRKLQQHSTPPSPGQTPTGPSAPAQPRRVVSGRGVLPRQAVEAPVAQTGFGVDSNMGAKE